jgi:hypothetical protein
LVWNDAMTELESRSLGTEEYRRLLLAVRLSISNEYRDEGQKRYYDVFQKRIEAMFKEITPVKSASVYKSNPPGRKTAYRDNWLFITPG